MIWQTTVKLDQIDLDNVLAMVNDLAGALDHLATAHAGIAANQENNGDSKALAATFSMLHRHTTMIAAIFDPG